MFKELGKSRNLGVPALALILILLVISMPVEARKGSDGSSANSQSGREGRGAIQKSGTEQKANQPSYQEIRGGANRAGPLQDRQAVRAPRQVEPQVNVTPRTERRVEQNISTQPRQERIQPVTNPPRDNQVRVQPSPSPMQPLQAKNSEKSVRNRDGSESNSRVNIKDTGNRAIERPVRETKIAEPMGRPSNNTNNKSVVKNEMPKSDQSQMSGQKNKPKARLSDAIVQKADSGSAKNTPRNGRGDIAKNIESESPKKSDVREYNNSPGDNKQVDKSKTNWQRHQEYSADKGIDSKKRMENYRGTRLQPVTNLSQKVAINKGGDRRFGDNHNDRDGHRDGYKKFYEHSYRDLHVRPVHRYEHVYVNRHNVECHRIIWPSYSYFVYYGHGSHYNFSAVFPYYHRKYVFVSLGGWWPEDYCYARYYWYGYHPYEWYGYYPIAKEVQGDTYNYYTYNYYNNNPAAPSGSSEGAVQNQVEDTSVTGDYENTQLDDTTFAAARAKASQQPAKPTETDNYFEEGVKAFEAADYNTACEKFAKALQLTPDDLIAPYAYSQSLFAKGLYQEAAAVLRAALDKVKPQQEGVFYPRGLYSDDEILLNQIDLLKKKAADNNSDSDMQLLLGYHYVGIGELELAQEPLRQSSLNLINKKYADILLDLIDKIKVEKDKDSQPTKVQ